MLCVRNAAENDWISIQYPGNYKWIGYTDMPPYGGGKGTKQYGWVTGCISTFTSWYPNQPDNAGNNEDYVQVNGNGQWNDQTPEATYPCGCQYTPTTSTPSSTPTRAPSSTPSSGSTVAPSSGPTIAQSSSPTATPSSSPTANPSSSPTSTQSSSPTSTPSSRPTSTPSSGPTSTPSSSPTSSPTTVPSSGAITE